MGEYIRRYADDGCVLFQLVVAPGETECITGHEEWWIPDTGCPWCKAVV